MTDIVQIHNIGALVAVATSVEPQSSAAATVNGTGIDRFAHNNARSCVLHQAVGAVGGAPSATSVQTKLQDSADNSTFADYKPDGSTVQQTSASTAANTEASAAIDLGSARRYVRAVTTISFTGGTAPTALVAADIVFGGEGVNPAA